VHVGARVRLRRNMLRLSRKHLIEALGLSAHQLRKYELGADRIGAGRLAQIGQILAVPVTFFFDAADPGLVPARARRSAAVEDGSTARDPMPHE
jgi:transcriptional regulator with XRE-family HTH domain